MIQSVAPLPRVIAKYFTRNDIAQGERPRRRASSATPNSKLKGVQLNAPTHLLFLCLNCFFLEEESFYLLRCCLGKLFFSN